MTIQEQNETIASFCGYWKDTDSRWHRSSGAYRNVPNYTCNLNDMYQAESNLSYRTQEIYLHHLCGLVHPTGRLMTDILSMNDMWFVSHAKAHQRAEAFLKTIGKWKE